MQDVSPAAWAFIICIAAVLIVLNVGLVAFLKYRPTIEKKSHTFHGAQNMNRLIEVVKDPFKDERTQLNKLSELVSRLEKPPPDDQNP